MIIGIRLPRKDVRSHQADPRPTCSANGPHFGNIGWVLMCIEGGIYKWVLSGVLPLEGLQSGNCECRKCFHQIKERTESTYLEQVAINPICSNSVTVQKARSVTVTRAESVLRIRRNGTGKCTKVSKRYKQPQRRGATLYFSTWSCKTGKRIWSSMRKIMGQPSPISKRNHVYY